MKKHLQRKLLNLVTQIQSLFQQRCLIFEGFSFKGKNVAESQYIHRYIYILQAKATEHCYNYLTALKTYQWYCSCP